MFRSMPRGTSETVSQVTQEEEAEMILSQDTMRVGEGRWKLEDTFQPRARGFGVPTHIWN